MYILVVGCGKVGYQLARVLLALGHEVLAVEKDATRCQSLSDELGSVALHGDGTEVQVLRRAGAARADLLIAVATRDEDNLAACQLAKTVFHTPRTMSLVKDPGNEALFKLLEVDVTVNTTHLILSAIEEEVPGQALVHMANVMNLGARQMELVSISIPHDAAVVGKALGALDLPPNSLISLVAKSGGPVMPSEELVLEPGDEVVVVTSPQEEQLLYETLTGVE